MWDNIIRIGLLLPDIPKLSFEQFMCSKMQDAKVSGQKDDCRARGAGGKSLYQKLTMGLIAGLAGLTNMP